MWVVLLTTAVSSLLTSMAECEGSRVDERENFLFCTHDLIQHLQHQGLLPMEFCSPLQVYINNNRSFNNFLTPTSHLALQRCLLQPLLAAGGRAVRG